MDTILIVDDESSIVMLAQNILKEDGYRFLTASDGLQGKKIIEQRWNDISAIILDWTMPHMSGIQLLQWIKDQDHLDHIPVIMQTAMTSPENVKEGIEAGAFYYLTKPTRREVLQSIVKAAVYDFTFKKKLMEKLRESENSFKLLMEGKFHFRTLAEGDYLAVRIANASPIPEKALVISEIISNSVEHGNLDITYEEKSGLIAEGKWITEVERRLQDPAHANKFVSLEFRRHPNKITVLVEDQGSGFDFGQYLSFDESRVFDNHGRGIAMTRLYLDLQYLDSGNKVLVTIPFQ